MDNDKKTITQPRKKNFVKDAKQKKKKEKNEERAAFPCPVSTRVTKSYHRKVSAKTLYSLISALHHRVLSP